MNVEEFIEQAQKLREAVKRIEAAEVKRQEEESRQRELAKLATGKERKPRDEGENR